MSWSKVVTGIGLLIVALMMLSNDSFRCFALPVFGASLYFLLSGASQKTTEHKTSEQRLSDQGHSFGSSNTATRSSTTSRQQPRQSRSGANVTISTRYTTRDSQFVEQARKYAQHQGKPTDHVRFKTYWPTYGDMDAAQQAWYFYWRDQVRQGRYPDTSLSYIFLHVYELINNIGVADGDDGYRQLRHLWLNYRERFPKLDHYLVDWITDYLAVNRSSHDPLSIYADSELQPVLAENSPDLVLHVFRERSSPIREMPLSLLDALTDHKIRKSTFYRSGFDGIVDTTLRQVLSAVDEHLRQKDGKGIFQTYRPKKRTQVSRGSFNSAVYHGSSRTVAIAHIYAYSKHEPLRKFLTAVVKHTENLLRQKYNFAGRLKVPSLSREVATVTEKVVLSRDTAVLEAAEFEVQDRTATRKSGVGVPIPPQKKPAFASMGNLRVVSSEYLKTAQEFASRKAKQCELVSLETPFTSYSHDYRDLTQDQADWYFYWRDQVRQGRYPATDLAYIFIHAPELIHLVGTNDANDAYQQLRALWLNYREQHPKIEPYLVGWMLSFVTVHECEVSPRDVLLEPCAYDFGVSTAPDVLLTQYLDDRLREIPLDLLDQFIDHDIRRSSFYVPEHRELLQRMLPAAIEIIDKHQAANGNGTLFEQYKAHSAVVEVKRCWRASQTYDQWPTRIVFNTIPAYSQHEKVRRLLTGIVKYTENKLREEKDHRGRLRVRGVDKQTQALIDRLIAQNSDLISPPPPAPKIEIDLARVETLRSESEEVLGMLKMDEEGEEEAPPTSPEPPIETIEQTSPGTVEAPEPAIAVPEGGTEEEIWRAMAIALDDHQVDVLAAILNGDKPEATIHHIANEQFMMPTMLVDSINELAQDIIGDILIESESPPRLIDDYYEPMVANIIEQRKSQ